MPLPVDIRLELDGSIECNFKSFSVSLTAESIKDNSATFEVPVHNYDGKTMLRPDIKEGLKAKVYINNELRLTGELEEPNRKTSKSEACISLTVKSNGKKASNTSAKVKNGDMLNAKEQDILKELAKNGGLEIDFSELDNDKITRHVTSGFERLDLELHRMTRDRGIHLYEKADGKLLATKKEYENEGCDLVFGEHFEDCESESSNEKSSKTLNSIGTRNLSKETGYNSCFTPQQKQDVNIGLSGVLNVYCEGDQTPNSLKAHSLYDTNRRAGADRKVTITIPSLVSPSGTAWGLRFKHRIISPPHGLDDDLVIKNIELKGSKDDVSATLTFAPLTSLSGKKGKASSDGGAKEEAKKSKINEFLINE
jgi:prophage tail gpP-like protein